MPAVPRLLNRVYDKINNEISNSPIKKMLFRMALNSKEAELKRGIIRKNSLWDKLVFRKVQEAFGGRLRLMVRKNLESCRSERLMNSRPPGYRISSTRRARVNVYPLCPWVSRGGRIWTDRMCRGGDLDCARRLHTWSRWTANRMLLC